MCNSSFNLSNQHYLAVIAIFRLFLSFISCVLIFYRIKISISDICVHSFLHWVIIYWTAWLFSAEHVYLFLRFENTSWTDKMARRQMSLFSFLKPKVENKEKIVKIVLEKLVDDVVRGEEDVYIVNKPVNNVNKQTSKPPKKIRLIILWQQKKSINGRMINASNFGIHQAENL